MYKDGSTYSTFSCMVWCYVLASEYVRIQNIKFLVFTTQQHRCTHFNLFIIFNILLQIHPHVSQSTLQTKATQIHQSVRLSKGWRLLGNGRESSWVNTFSLLILFLRACVVVWLFLIFFFLCAFPFSDSFFAVYYLLTYLHYYIHTFDSKIFRLVYSFKV